MTKEAVKEIGVTVLPAADVPSIWGLKPEERIRRQLPASGLNPDLAQGRTCLLLRGDVIYESAVLAGMVHSPTVLVREQDGTPLAAHVPSGAKPVARRWLTGDGPAPAGFDQASPPEIGGAYNQALRKRVPAACYVVTAANARDIERTLYKASYKGITDVVTKYLWPVPAYHATRLCQKLGLSPNMVTSVGAILVLAALWLFWDGQYGWGLLAGWVMTFLDTVDGKLARVTLTPSKLGNIFDHGIDLVHPPFWYMGWGVGLSAYGTPLPEGWLPPALWAMVAFYGLGRVVEGYFMRRFGMHLHVWRRFDSNFRLILARRNPNLIVLSLSWIAERPDVGLLIVVAWHAVTFFVHVVQLAQAESIRRRGKVVHSWLSI